MEVLKDTAAALAVATASVGQQALCLAVTALRLADNTPSLVSMDEVAWHDHSQDCWIVLYDRVYDITSFLYEHPGGEGILLEYAGRDATLAFRGIGHDLDMMNALESCLVGVLPESERIWASGKLRGS